MEVVARGVNGDEAVAHPSPVAHATSNPSPLGGCQAHPVALAWVSFPRISSPCNILGVSPPGAHVKRAGVHRRGAGGGVPPQRQKAPPPGGAFVAVFRSAYRRSV